VTDGEGKFALEALDPELRFKLLVYHEGYVPTFSEDYCDPREGPVKLALARHDLDQRDPERVLHGRIVDAHGDPVARAIVSPVGRKTARGQQYGGLDDVDALALSNAHGEFELGVGEPKEELMVSIEAAAFAPRMAPWLKSGDEENTVTLTRGVTVTGIVEKDGHGLAGVELGIVQVDRDTAKFTGERTVGTDERGRFTFVNVGPNELWSVYGKMTSLRSRGALVTREARTLADESTLDLGHLAVEPSARLSGRVVLSDDLPLPAGLQLILTRENAWDSATTVVAADGSFAFEGVPHELVSLYTRVRDYVISPKNASCDSINDSGLLGLIDGDVRDLVLLLEPGERGTMFDASSITQEAWERYQALKKAPLRGAPLEAAAAKPR
jgi:hypothetical protein